MADRQNDSHEVQCRVCGLTKKRIRKGAFTRRGRGSTPKWMDEQERLWNGLTCPDCHKKRAAVYTYIRKVK